MGIEPTSEAWEASILPLNYARSSLALGQNSIRLWAAQGTLGQVSVAHDVSGGISK